MGLGTDLEAFGFEVGTRKSGLEVLVPSLTGTLGKSELLSLSLHLATE